MTYGSRTPYRETSDSLGEPPNQSNEPFSPDPSIHSFREDGITDRMIRVKAPYR